MNRSEIHVAPPDAVIRFVETPSGINAFAVITEEQAQAINTGIKLFEMLMPDLLELQRISSVTYGAVGAGKNK